MEKSWKKSKGKRGRPTYLTDDIKQLISELKASNPEIQAKEVIDKVKQYLIEIFPRIDNMTKEEIEALVINEQLSPSAITKFLTELNHRLGTKSELDEPWHISTLKIYPIPTEALPIVLRVWADLASKNKLFTIRMAKWVVYLYNTQGNKPIDFLITMAMNYARGELICEVAGIEWNSSTLDYWLYHEITGEDYNSEFSTNLLKSLLSNKYEEMIPSKMEYEEILKKHRAQEENKTNEKHD
jgi:hypothetical protein